MRHENQIDVRVLSQPQSKLPCSMIQLRMCSNTVACQCICSQCCTKRTLVQSMNPKPRSIIACQLMLSDLYRSLCETFLETCAEFQIPARRADCADACMRQRWSTLASACHSMLATGSLPATCMLPRDSLPETHMHSVCNLLCLDGSHMPTNCTAQHQVSHGDYWYGICH